MCWNELQCKDSGGAGTHQRCLDDLGAGAVGSVACSKRVSTLGGGIIWYKILNPLDNETLLLKVVGRKLPTSVSWLDIESDLVEVTVKGGER